jgi:hypothetical protein
MNNLQKNKVINYIQKNDLNNLYISNYYAGVVLSISGSFIIIDLGNKFIIKYPIKIFKKQNPNAIINKKQLQKLIGTPFLLYISQFENFKNDIVFDLTKSKSLIKFKSKQLAAQKKEIGFSNYSASLDPFKKETNEKDAIIALKQIKLATILNSTKGGYIKALNSKTYFEPIYFKNNISFLNRLSKDYTLKDSQRIKINEIKQAKYNDKINKMKRIRKFHKRLSKKINCFNTNNIKKKNQFSYSKEHSLLANKAKSFNFFSNLSFRIYKKNKLKFKFVQKQLKKAVRFNTNYKLQKRKNKLEKLKKKIKKINKKKIYAIKR